ncbi:MAG: peptide chain release factor N(5)-glutamine methyltransferase [Candidatus Sumerlaeota bacterium]|nr:peptide chain release factor N(5)-glutamine methyltransferase [Candidatus Sumerlaeota bacterium]
MPSEPLTIRTLLAKTTPYLQSKGSLSPRLDAEALLAETLGCDRLHLYLDMDRPLNPAEVDQYRECVKRRAAGEPVAYIIGYREFRGLPFAVDRRVLIPRPETEGVVDLAMEMLKGVAAPRILDVGTGSGAIAVSLAREIEGARVWATDRSAGALELARRNADQLGVGGRMAFVEGDLFAGLAGPFDLVVCNPPYVADGDRATLQRDVVDYEPHEALFAGPDGLGFIRRLVAEAPARLVAGGKLVFEIGQGQAKAVEQLLRESPRLSFLTLVPDLRGIPRVAAAEKTKQGDKAEE